MTQHYIIGKACADYNETLDRLKRTVKPNLSLNEDSFNNWRVVRRTDTIIRKVVNDGILELVDG
jgi:hypothetical protein